jgi:hypothetical protein
VLSNQNIFPYDDFNLIVHFMHHNMIVQYIMKMIKNQLKVVTCCIGSNPQNVSFRCNLSNASKIAP